MTKRFFKLISLARVSVFTIPRIHFSGFIEKVQTRSCQEQQDAQLHHFFFHGGRIGVLGVIPKQNVQKKAHQYR